jgi:hypothetical protein
MAVDPTTSWDPDEPLEIANIEAFVPLKASVPDQLEGATLIGQTTAPAASGATNVAVTGQVTAVDAGLLMTIERLIVEAYAAAGATRANPSNNATRFDI